MDCYTTLLPSLLGPYRYERDTRDESMRVLLCQSDYAVLREFVADARPCPPLRLISGESEISDDFLSTIRRLCGNLDQPHLTI